MRILSFFGVLLSACNSAPGPVTIALSPEAPLTTDAIEVVIIGESADPDAKSSVTYTYLWYRDNEAQTDLDGTSIGSEMTTKGEAWKVIVMPTDGELQGPPAAAEVQVRNTPPIATVSVSLETPLSTESVSAAAETSDADDDAVEVSFVWTVEGDSDRKIDGEELSSDETTKGEVWTVTVTPKDDEEDGEPATASVSIENVAPVVDSLELHPGDAFEDSTLEAVVETSDEDEDTVTLSYAWTVDGSVLPDATDRLLFHEQFDKHSVVSVTVTPNDGFVDGDSVTSEDKTIQNSPPTLTGASLTPTEIYESSTVYCVPEGYADLDGDTASYTYSWTVDGSDAGSTADGVDGFYFDKGQAVACTVIPNDGEMDGDPATSASLTVGNTAPVATGVDISSGASAYEADTLEAGNLAYTDDDGDSVTWNYSWSVDGTLVISGPTDTALTGLYFSKGQSVTVTVTPNDGTDNGSSFTSVATTILNSLPRVDSLILHNDSPAVNDSIGTSETTSDDDGDDVSVTWSWAVNGTTLPGETDPGLIGSGQFQKGDVITCTATPYETNDPAVVGAPYSVDVTAVNSGPTGPGAVSLAPTSPIEQRDDLLCTVDTEATDADGDPINYVFEWYVDTLLWTGTSSDTSLTSTVAAAETTAGETWTCRANSFDDENCCGSYTDATVTISANSPPTAAGISLAPSEPVEGQDDLVCTVDTASTDAEGDPITYSFEWLVDGFAWNGTSADTALTSTVGGSETSAGEDWTCRVWPDDGWDVGDSAELVVTVTLECGSDSYGDGVDGDCDGLDCAGLFDTSGNYFTFCPQELSWAAADLSCRNAGHDGLATILSQADQDFVNANMIGDGNVWWVGLTDEDSEGTFYWESGFPVLYENWQSGQPNNGGGNQDYTYVHGTSHTNIGVWADDSSGSNWSYICETRVLIDNDGDGVAWPTDCDDNDPSVSAGLRNGTANCPAQSCDSLLTDHPGSTDGLYYLDPELDDTDVVQGYCDMTTDGGGWTRILGLDISDSSFPGANGLGLADGLAAAATGTGHVLPNSLRSLRNLTGFNELRFECEKDAVGRKFHIVTSNSSVLDYYTNQGGVVTAAGTFSVYADDTSNLSANPNSWTGSGWGSQWVDADKRLHSPAMNIPSQAHFMLGGGYSGTNNVRYECDDYDEGPTWQSNGSWSIWVR